jgi:hypothetical protein
MGHIGDIYIETTHDKEVIDILSSNSNTKIKQPENFDKHILYHRTDAGWTPMDKRKSDNGRPFTTYPQNNAFVLDPFTFTWRSRDIRNYSNRGQPSSTPPPPPPPNQDGVGEKSKKRARTAYNQQIIRPPKPAIIADNKYPQQPQSPPTDDDVLASWIYLMAVENHRLGGTRPSLAH